MLKVMLIIVTQSRAQPLSMVKISLRRRRVRSFARWSDVVQTRWVCRRGGGLGCVKRWWP